MGDGDGWVTCRLGHRHWGRYGAAGLLIRTADELVLQHRAPWSHHGDTWGLPGGARDSHESAVAAALREAAEEAGVEAADVLVTGVHTDDHGGWSYATVLAEPVARVQPVSTSAESVQVRWHPIPDVAHLPLHPGFAACWPGLAARWPAPVIVVDVANVLGSRPDGWWRDRAGATQRLGDQLAVFARTGLAPRGTSLGAGVVGLSWVYPKLVLVVEGAARGVELAADPRVEVVRAAGSGDDAVVDVVRRTPNAVVLTADRHLRERVRGLAAAVHGPRWLLDDLPGTARPEG